MAVRTRSGLFVAIVFGMGIAFAGPAAIASASTTNYWVDPVAGSDSNPGTSSAQAFKTLAMAQTAVRAVNGSMSGDIDVNLMSGIYAQTSTLSLNSSDSGTNGNFVRWQAASGATPVISGAQTISGWTSAGNGQYKASVGSLGFRQFYVNGVEATRAQSPDSGWYQIIASSSTDKTITVSASSVGSWAGQGTPEMVLETQWGESYLRVTSIVVNGSSATVSFNGAEAGILFQRPYPILANGSPFRWQNEAAFVTQPGEWYLDSPSSTVYYLPRAGENMSSATVTAPSVQTLVDISGANLDSPAQNISFSGITFTGTTWMFPTTSGYLNGQGGMYNISANLQNQQYVGRPPAAVHVSDANNIQIVSDTFRGVGSTALDLDHGTHTSSVIGNIINGAAGNGITVGKFSDPTVLFGTLYNPPSSPAGEDVREVATGNTVNNNLITRIGTDYFGTAGINVGWTSGTTIEHNEISDVPWSAISVGWGWQHNAGAASNNTVEFNEIGNAVNRLCDTGGIYHLSVDPGSTYSNNYLHDINHSPAACSSATAGLYLDEGSDQLTASNNVISNVDNPVVQNVNGSSVTLSNNVSSGTSVIRGAGLEAAYSGLRNSVDLAYGKSTSASSTYASGFAASAAADGLGSTGWSPTGADTNAWWQVDLGTAISIDQVQVLARQDIDQPTTRTGFQVEVSNDPSFATYTTVGRETASIPDAGSVDFNVSTSAAFRYLRVQKTDGQYFFIAEVRVLGAEGATGSAPADPGTSGSSYYYLTNVNSGLVGDIANSSTTDGTPLEQWTKNSGANQQWQIQSVGGGLYKIINHNSGLTLGVAESSNYRGAPVDQEAITGSNSQLWYFEAGPAGSYVIRNFQSKQALEVGGASTSDGGTVNQWTPLNQPNQQWTLSVTTGSTPTPTTPPSGGCSAALTVASSWNGGFQAAVTVTAGSSAISNWSTSLTLPAGVSIGNLWSGTLSGSASPFTVTNAAWNGALAAGQSTTYGFTATGLAPSGETLPCSAS